MSITRYIAIARQRRRLLRYRFDVNSCFETLEETCVPSYLHKNIIASSVAWLRLMVATDLYTHYGPEGPLLDFGASSGELFHMLEPKGPCHFIEELPTLRDALIADLPEACEERLAALPKEIFKTIFALDSLEHNENIGLLVDTLIASLAPDGVMIVSGPTENWLYRLGRKIAGFDGHYHHKTIFDIEAEISKRLILKAVKVAPIGVPLFRLSVWSKT